MSKPTARELCDAARDELGKGGVLAVRVEAVLALHTEFKVYDAEDEDQFTPDTYLYSVCRECHTDDGEVREDTDEYEWPCPTVRLLDGLAK